MKRRVFLEKAGMAVTAAIAVPAIIPAACVGRNGQTAPSDKINLAFIGAGNQATNDVMDFLNDDRVVVTLICDVNQRSDGYWDGRVAGRDYICDIVNGYYSKKYNRRYNACSGVEDFREVLSRKEIDAVEVATPDHWHAIPVMMAAAARKDIYCQKPLSLTIAEGRAMSDAVRHHDVVFQTGSQQRSNINFRRICEVVRNGHIGKLETVICGLPAGTPDFGKKAHLTEEAPVPRGFNYDLWLGPAPFAPYATCRTHVNFRWIMDYSGGQLTDWGGHHPDIAQWGMDTELTGPVKIQNAKSKWAEHPHYNTATDFYFECMYENGVKLIVQSGDNFGVTFIGSEGRVWADRGKHTIEPDSLNDIVTGAGDVQLYHSDNHFRNFIDCVISREEPIAPVEVAHRSITIAHLGNIAMMLDRDLEWDPKAERVLNDPKANGMLSRPMRSPWDGVYNELLVKSTATG